MLNYSLLRWEGLALLFGAIALTFLLSAVNVSLLGIPNLVWLAVGLAGYLTLAYTTLKDPKTGQKIAADLLHQQYDPKKIQDQRLQDKIEEALDYRSRITELINERDDSALKTQLASMAAQFDEWIEEIYILAERLDEYRGQRGNLERNYLRAREQLAKLEAGGGSGACRTSRCARKSRATSTACGGR